MKWWDQMPWSLFSECWALSQLFHSPLSLSSRGSLVLLHFSAIRVVSSAYLRLLIFFLAILIPACAASSPAFLMMYSAYKLNKQDDSMQPWRTPFAIWNQSVVPCSVLTVASWPAYRFLKRQVRWSGISFSTILKYCHLKSYFSMPLFSVFFSRSTFLWHIYYLPMVFSLLLVIEWYTSNSLEAK